MLLSELVGTNSRFHTVPLVTKQHIFFTLITYTYFSLTHSQSFLLLWLQRSPAWSRRHQVSNLCTYIVLMVHTCMGKQCVKPPLMREERKPTSPTHNKAICCMSQEGPCKYACDINVFSSSQCLTHFSQQLFFFCGFTLGIILGVGVAQGSISTLKVTQWQSGAQILL